MFDLTKDLHFPEPLIRPIRLTWREICEKLNIPYVSTKSNKGKEFRDKVLENLSKNYNIKTVDNKKYTFSEKEPQDKKFQKQQIKKSKGIITYVPELDKEVDLKSNNLYSKIGFSQYLLYLALNSHTETTQEFMLLVYHSMGIYDKLYNHNYSQSNQDSYNNFILNNNIQDVILGEDFLNEYLYREVFDTLKDFQNKGQLDIFEYYMDNFNHKISIEELNPLLNSEAVKKGYPNLFLLKKSLGRDKFYEWRDEVYQELIKNNINNFGLLLDENTNVKDYQIKIKRYEIFKGNKLKIIPFLTKKQQANIIYKFIGIFRERFYMQIMNNPKRTATKRKEMRQGFGKEFEIKLFSLYKPYLYVNKDNYYTPQEFEEDNLFHNYNTNLIKTLRNKTPSEIDELLIKLKLFREKLK